MRDSQAIRLSACLLSDVQSIPCGVHVDVDEGELARAASMEDVWRHWFRIERPVDKFRLTVWSTLRRTSADSGGPAAGDGAADAAGDHSARVHNETRAVIGIL